MKERLDIILVKKGYFETRQRAKSEIMLGNVIVNEQKITKAGTFFKEDVSIRVKGAINKYVSRGGLKLEKAINEFNLNFEGKIVLDIGSSTGGFTHCALEHGADFVYSVDVGTNQIHFKLRTNQCVKVMENTHIKDLKIEDIDRKVDFIVTDVSFISLTNVIPHFIKFMNNNTKIIALIKPQFEVGKENIGKNGVVKDRKHHIHAIEKVIECVASLGLYADNICSSGILGAKGNKEYLLLISQDKPQNDINIIEIVENNNNSN